MQFVGFRLPSEAITKSILHEQIEERSKAYHCIAGDGIAAAHMCEGAPRPLRNLRFRRIFPSSWQKNRTKLYRSLRAKSAGESRCVRIVTQSNVVAN